MVVIFFVFIFRFSGAKIYTYIGEVCVSVNPYRTMNIYGPEFVNQYKGIILILYKECKNKYVYILKIRWIKISLIN
jgi:hypothetical protein